MTARGLQDIPFRIPDKWDAQWYREHIRDVLTKLDVRNAVEGAGISIEGTPDEVATISSSEDLLDLKEQAYLLAGSSSFLQNERILEGESGVVSTTDEGPGGDFTIGIVDGGITNSKLRSSAALSVIGRPTAEAGQPFDIESSAPDTVLRRVTGTLADEIDWGSLTLAMAADGLWTYAKIEQPDADGKFLVRRAGVLTADVLADGDIPAGIARDAEVAAAYQPISAALAQVYRGTGDPNSVVTAPIGAFYQRSDGGAGTSFYVKESDPTGATGWVAK